MYKVKLNSSLSVKDFTICVIILFFVYLFCRVHNLNLNPIYFIIALVIGGGLEFINSDDVVVSDLIVNARDIELIYKKRGKIVDKVVIKKSEILSFRVCGTIVEQFKKITATKSLFSIDLKNGKNVSFVVKSNASDIKPSKIFDSTFQPLINIAKAQYKCKFPNFSCEINGSKYVKDVIECYLKNGKCTFWQNTIIQYNSSPEDKFSIIFSYAIIGSIILIFICLPLFFLLSKFI